MIEKGQLAGIEKQAGDVVSLINDGTHWVNEYLKDEEQEQSRYALKKFRRQINKIKAVVNQKPTIALFGASQVGKSYMANNLLYNKDNKLEVYDHKSGKNIDFIKELNPEGKGNEATSAVTRFTSEMAQADQDKPPVKLKLFDVKDVMCVLCDSFFNDFKNEGEPFTKQQVLDHMEQVRRMCADNPVQTTLSDDDVYLVKEYVEKYFKGNILITELRSCGFWDLFAENIQYIAADNWASCFSILWHFDQSITQVFDTSLSFLKTLSFSRAVFAGFETLYRKDGAPIINVQTLQGFFEHDVQQFEVLAENGKTLSVKSSQLCFMTAEIVLCVSEGSTDNRPFIKEVDIVDFPGARSRPEITTINRESMLEMMLRGKVSYLFNHYSTSFKTNVLVTCMRTQQTNVTTVPRLVNQWITDNLGATAEERGKNITEQIPPLFIIFTWWNTQLEFKKATDDPDPTERIEKLFEARFRQEIIGDFDWNQSWIRTEGHAERFKNYFLLRDFKESLNIFKNNEQGVELSEFMNADQEKFHAAYYEKFKSYHKERNVFFEDPEMNFRESSTAQKDGSELIIQNLMRVSKNEISTSIYINYLNKALKAAKKELSKHFHSDQADDQIKKSARDAAELQLKTDIIFGKDAYVFGDFLEHLVLKENEILAFYHDLLKSDKLIKSKDTNPYILLRSHNPELSPQKSYDENLEILRRNYHLTSADETKRKFTEGEKIDLHELFFGEIYDLKRNSVVLAESARDYWFDQKLNTDHFQSFVDLGFEKKQLNDLFDSLRTSFMKHNLTEVVAESIRDYVDVQKKIDRAEEMIAHITIGIFNRFVNTSGWAFYAASEKNKIRETNQANQLSLQVPDDNETRKEVVKFDEDNSQTVTVSKLIDYMDNITYHLSQKPIDPKAAEYVPMLNQYHQWIKLVKIAFIANCDIPNYNVEANAQLGKLLDHFQELKFSLQ